MDTKEKLQLLRDRWVKEPENRKLIEARAKLLQWALEVEKIFVKEKPATPVNCSIDKLVNEE